MDISVKLLHNYGRELHDSHILIKNFIDFIMT